MYVRIVEVEAYLDAKSDDTMCMCERKKDTLVRFPSNVGCRKPRWQKKRKNGGSKIAQKIVFSPVLATGFVSCDTLFVA